MSRPKHDVVTKVTPAFASQTNYDVVIVGSGVSGAILALELSKQSYRVLVVEAGAGGDMTIAGYEDYLSEFYASVSKDPNSPYRANRNAPMPRSPDVRRLYDGQTDSESYIVQNGPTPLDGTYSRIVGGTTMHWQGNVPRMLPEDFEMRTRFGHGIDWPINYEALMPYYRQAEYELGVSADVEEQSYSGIAFEEDYVFPMRKMPATYLDKQFADGLDGAGFYVGAEQRQLKVRGIPQARNGIPNPQYGGGKSFKVNGAVSSHQAEMGDRCQGNTNCTPICPVQAKYDARRTLAKAMRTGRVDLLPQSVASRVVVDPASGRVQEIEVKSYSSLQSPEFVTHKVRGRSFVLAANAIENARLMLASGLPGTNGLMGRHLMNHVYLFAWALMPARAGAMRGTQGTSGIEEFRGGTFRAKHAGFHIDIINNGWTYATGAPYTDLENLVEHGNKYGRDLRSALADQVSRQALLAFMVDVPADPGNRISVDPKYRDPLGNMRPVASYSVPEYSVHGAAFGRAVSQRIFQTLGAEDFTCYHPLDFGYINYQGAGLTLNGGNHFSGTHIMGSSPSRSVVDSDQRSWEHQNLYLTGSGSMPSIGTSNPTLTLAALCYRTADAIKKDLG